MVRRLLPYIAVVLAMIIWSASGIAIKASLISFSPMALILTRFTVAVLLMLILGICLHGNSVLGLQNIRREDIWLFVLGGMFEPFLYYLFETYCYKSFDSPTLAEAFLSTNPLIAPIFAFIFLREKITIWNILGILVSTAGMLLMVLGGAKDLSLGDPVGIPLAFVTVSMAVTYTVMLKKVSDRYSALSVIFWMELFGLVYFYLLTGVTYLCGDTSTLYSLFSVQISELTGESFTGIAYLSVFSSVVAFILFCYCVRYVGVTHTNIFNNCRPIFTALLMLIVAGEHLPFVKWIGIFIIILGLFISQKRPKSS